MGFFEYITANQQEIFLLLIEHIKLTAMSILLAILVGVPIGILISYIHSLKKPILGVTNVIQAIPSMALLGFSIPLLGIGALPAILMVILYSLLPIIKSTNVGIDSINPETIESANGIGLTKWQVLTKVQIPLALPIIMSGVRISAVTAVGLMTIAAFVGAGGLGSMVFAGIRTVNNNQILAGAIPACLLALFVDYIFSIIETIVTPKNAKMVNTKKQETKYKIKKVILSITSIALVIIFIVSAIPTVKNERTITIASKDYSEQNILAYMVAEMIEEKTDITVEKKMDLGGTQVILPAIKSGDVDLYVEYMGVAYGEILGINGSEDSDTMFNKIKETFNDEYNLGVLPYTKFNNTYTLTVTKATAEKYNLKTLSDLAKVSGELKSGTGLEFLTREFAMPALTKEYGIKFKESIGVDGAIRYTALMNGEVDVIDAFSTDALVKKFDLVILEDDKTVFPSYQAFPVIRNETLEEYPEIAELINEVLSKLDNEKMMDLNFKVDVEQQNPEDVAREFLVSENLID